MKEAVVAKAYAKSIYQLGEETNVAIADEFTKLTQVINENNDLETVLFLDVFTPEEKEAVLTDVLAKLNVSPLLKNSISFLMQEKRVGLMPMIYKNLIVLDDHKKGFMRGTIEGRGDEMDPEFEKKILSFLSQKLGTEPKLTYKKSTKVTAGYKVTVDDLQLDATVDNQLNKLKSEILNS
ncbi:MAG: F0F1 ATP synthase subunit delta [Halobacteriovoraceae bacterium]|nr:F0F1 ATP synthase subunit delta [Halobacteriovoraceae bacterium]